MENKDALQNEEVLQDDINEQPEAAENGESDAFSKEIETLQAQVSELKNKILYQQAEFDGTSTSVSCFPLPIHRSVPPGQRPAVFATSPLT